MFRRIGISLIIAMALMVLLVAAVGAQSAADDGEPVAASIVPMGGGIVQAIPLTLTVNVPGPDGIMSVEVPIVLSLDIQIALGNVLTSTVVVTAEIPASDAAEAIAEVTAEETAEAEETVTPTPTPLPPTPTPIPPTAVPEEPTVEPTEAAPTPAPVGATAEPTEAPEEEATAAPEGEGTGEGEETATPEPVADLDPENCSDSRSVIYAPEAGEEVSGDVEIYGTARHEQFNYYKLEYLQAGSETGEYAFIMDSSNSVTDGTLADLDTTELDNGDYVLRLTVVDNTGNFPPQCSVPVRIAN